MSNGRGEEETPQFSYQDAASIAHMGYAEHLTAQERDRVGAGAGPLGVLTLFLGIFGLGPAGLVTGAIALRAQRESRWLPLAGMVLSAAHTLVLLTALVLALATG